VQDLQQGGGMSVVKHVMQDYGIPACEDGRMRIHGRPDHYGPMMRDIAARPQSIADVTCVRCLRILDLAGKYAGVALSGLERETLT
jgi:hypothetical protein